VKLYIIYYYIILYYIILYYIILYYIILYYIILTLAADTHCKHSQLVQSLLTSQGDEGKST